MNSLLVPLTCPHCPGSTRIFTEHGLKIHIGRMHKQLGQSVSMRQNTPAATSCLASDPGPQVSPPSSHLDRLAALKGSTPVLRHIPKGARNLAAGKLSDIIEKCVSCNGVGDWYLLLSFAYGALRVPSKDAPGNVTSKVRGNVQSSGLEQQIEGSNSRGVGKTRSVERAIESKVFEGDLRGAVRLLLSDDTIAQNDSVTLAALTLKHPSPSRPLVFPPEPDKSYSPVSVSVEDVANALNTFYSGSAAGLDGIRPGHLKELTAPSAGENGPRLLESLTKLVNFLLSGQLNVEVCTYLYGASLFALDKKDGGVRPIAVGSVFRRLAAKLACRAVRESVSGYLQPHQLGFGTRRGCEAAVHATRAFVLDPANSGCVVVKLDVCNAFNTLERDILLSEAREKIPAAYPFLHQLYSTSSSLFFGTKLISSQVGAQQGDPLGPLVFSLAIHKAITEIKSPLNLWYLDDGTIGGLPEDVFQDLLVLIPRLRELGLEVNPSKCEFFPCSSAACSHFNRFNAILSGLKQISLSNFNLLGSPIALDAVSEALATQKQLLLAAQVRLKRLSAHVALVLLRSSLAAPKITHLLRTTPAWMCQREVSSLDDTLRSAVESILNVSLNEVQWSQAALPIRYGGLGLRRAGDLSLPAFLASAHGVANLVSVILNTDGSKVSIPFVSGAISAWLALNSGESVPAAPHFQRAWDDIGARLIHKRLLDEAEGTNLARLRAVSQPESGAWLHALPSPHIGTLLDDDSLRVAVALRLGCKVCEPHICTCGSMVGSDGHHALSCRRCSGRFPRHHALNDIVRRALVSANVPCVLEPPGLSRTDGKRPDGLSLVPWKNGKCLVWDATCVCTFAASHLGRTVHSAAAAAEDAANTKRRKYAGMEPLYWFVPLAVETMGCWGYEARELLEEIGRRLRDKTGDPRSGSYLVQRLAIAIQRGNAASIMGTFAPGTVRGGVLF